MAGCMGFVNVARGLRAIGYTEADPLPTARHGDLDRLPPGRYRRTRFGRISSIRSRPTSVS